MISNLNKITNLESALSAVTKKELAQRNIIKLLTVENKQLKKQLKHYRESQGA